MGPPAVVCGEEGPDGRAAAITPLARASAVAQWLCGQQTCSEMVYVHVQQENDSAQL